MELNPSIIVVAIALYVVFRCVSRNAKSGTRRLPPEAGGAWPILGHLHLFRGSKFLHVALGEMADKYGPAFTIRIGVHRVLIVSDRKLAKELFTTHDVHISSRPRSRAAKHLGYNYVMFGFSPYGPYWRDLRRLTSLELLSSRRLELLEHIRASEIEASMNELYKLWTTENKNSDDGRVLVEMKQWFGDVTLNVVLRMVAGKRFFGDENERRRCQRVLREFFHFLGVSVPADALPFLGWLDIGGYEKAMKEVGKEMDCLVDEWLQEHRRKKEAAAAGGEQQDFMDVMLSLIEGIDLNGYHADTVTKSACINVVAGGADTIKVMLIWTLSLIMNHPNVLKKAQEELDMVIGKERRVNESDINSLIYLQAIVKETLRLYPAGPVGGYRMFTEDCTISSFHVPKGTWLLVNLWKLHRDPQVWYDPFEFKPERFIDSHKNIDVKGQDFELIPFGAGRRICPGTTFGLQMLHLVLANVLHSFELSTLSDVPIDMTESAGLTNIKATPLEILIAPRLSPSLF